MTCSQIQGLQRRSSCASAPSPVHLIWLHRSGNAVTISTVAAVATAAVAPLSIAVVSVGSAVLFAKWVVDVYLNTYVFYFHPVNQFFADLAFSPANIACIMGYVIDLTILMHRLFAIDVSEERVISVLEGYTKSGEIIQVHNDIRKFVNSGNLRHLGEDNVLNEIICLIEKYRFDSKWCRIGPGLTYLCCSSPSWFYCRSMVFAFSSWRPQKFQVTPCLPWIIDFTIRDCPSIFIECRCMAGSYNHAGCPYEK